MVPNYIFYFHWLKNNNVLSNPSNWINCSRKVINYAHQLLKIMSLLLNMLSRLVITFLPKSKHLLISWLQLPFAVILEPKKMKSAIVSTVSPSIFHEVMGPDAMFSECLFFVFQFFVFWMVSFKTAFALSSFTFIKRLFSSSLLSAVRMVPSAYLRLLIFLPAILIPACASTRPAFHMMYSAYK